MTIGIKGTVRAIPLPKPPITEIVPGARFGWLTVICAAGQTDQYVKKFKLRCGCGNETVVVAPSLQNGDTTSCGCRKRMVLSKRFKEHGSKSSSKLMDEDFDL